MNQKAVITVFGMKLVALLFFVSDVLMDFASIYGRTQVTAQKD